MSKPAPVPPALGRTFVVLAPLAAAVGAVIAIVRRSRRSPFTTRSSIRDVPARPALWDARPSTPVVGRASLRDVSPVPPENNHAPPTPPHGIPRQVS